MIAAIIIFLLRGAVFGYAARRISEYRNEPDGFWWGAILGTVGLLIVTLKPSTVGETIVYARPEKPTREPKVLKKNCPNCGALNNIGNSACFACGKSFQN